MYEYRRFQNLWQLRWLWYDHFKSTWFTSFNAYYAIVQPLFTLTGKISNKSTVINTLAIIGKHVAENNIRNHVRLFNSEVNLLMAQFKHIYSTTRYKLFRTYCMPLYGCQLWDFSGKEIYMFYTAWRKAIRMIWKLPYRCHSNLLHLICDDLNIEIQLHKRFLKFFHNLYHSENTILNYLAKLVVAGSRSATCNSFNYILSAYGISRQHFPSYNLQDLVLIPGKHRKETPDLVAVGKRIREVCEMRDGSLHANLSRDECTEIIALISTNWLLLYIDCWCELFYFIFVFDICIHICIFPLFFLMCTMFVRIKDL